MRFFLLGQIWVTMDHHQVTNWQGEQGYRKTCRPRLEPYTPGGAVVQHVLLVAPSFRSKPTCPSLLPAHWRSFLLAHTAPAIAIAMTTISSSTLLLVAATHDDALEAESAASRL